MITIIHPLGSQREFANFATGQWCSLRHAVSGNNNFGRDLCIVLVDWLILFGFITCHGSSETFKVAIPAPFYRVLIFCWGRRNNPLQVNQCMKHTAGRGLPWELLKKLSWIRSDLYIIAYSTSSVHCPKHLSATFGRL